MVNNFAPFDSFIDVENLHILQKQVQPAERAIVAQKLIEQISEILGKMGINSFEKSIDLESTVKTSTQSILKDGIAELGSLLDTDQTNQLVSFFDDRLCYDSHHIYQSNGVGSRRLEAEDKFKFGSYPLEDILQAPYLFEIAHSPAIISIAEEYLGCTPTLFSLNAWWSFAKNSRQENATQHIHRDRDDFKFCTLFIYLTDVDDEHGPHEYLRSTHTVEALADATGKKTLLKNHDKLNDLVRDFDEWAVKFFALDEQVVENPYSSLIDKLRMKILGPAGTAFMADNYGLHRANPLRQGNRLVFWARYGIYKNATYISQRTVPLQMPDAEIRAGDTPGHRYLNRLIVT